ncbi:MAG TPA: hypothetical protein VFW73_06275 [Lacipirellulaceae bacterium]|nr:hypothetical protein [Lacipirellulaceae bacterium]
MKSQSRKGDRAARFAACRGFQGTAAYRAFPTVSRLMRGTTFFLEPLAPFRLDLTAWTLRRRADNRIDRWDGATYRRVLVIEDQLVEVAVTQVEPPDSPRLRVTVTGADVDSKIKRRVVPLLNRMLGLQVDLSQFYRFAFHQGKLGPLARRFRGMRPPRFPSVFEAVINATACQQMSLTVGILLLNRLAEARGLAWEGNGAVSHAFPRPQDLVHREPRAIARLGFSRQKVRAMTEAAKAIDAGQRNLESLNEVPDDVALANLLELRGVGRWTAEYVLLRGLGRWHIFPGDDVGARNNLTRWLGLSEDLDYESVRRVLHRWRRFGGLIYFHLLLDSLAEKGDVK